MECTAIHDFDLENEAECTIRINAIKRNQERWLRCLEKLKSDATWQDLDFGALNELIAKAQCLVEAHQALTIARLEARAISQGISRARSERKGGRL
jgi:hypothetical protein